MTFSDREHTDRNEPSEEEIRRRKQKIKNMCQTLLSSDAASRLNNLRAVQPDLVTQVEREIIKLDQQGRLDKPVSDNDLKTVLQRMQDDGGDYDIKY